jgi:hypothetical protein
MAVQTGLRVKEIDESSLEDVWIAIEAFDMNRREEWEMVRVLSYNVAVFGNSDAKKIGTKQKFMPFPWDKKQKGNKFQEIIKRQAMKKALLESNKNASK